jgi:type II secretory pathway pseudopilin PulG
MEMLVVMLILGVVTGAVFSQMSVVQQRASTEQVKLDDFQEARDFVDQFFRDVNQIGYPSLRQVDTTSASWSPALPVSPTPLYNDSRLATGLVKIDADEIRFEGDTNGSGIVQSIRYAVNGSGTCTLCLQRSQAGKVSGDPLTAQVQNWGTEVNDVVSTQIFTYYDTNGVKITAIPADTSTAAGRQTLASVKTIQISLTIRNNAVVDQTSHQPIETNFEGEVSLNNCSMAANGLPMSCQ